MVSQAPDGTIQFRFFRPEARQVTLTGDFNGWDMANTPMTRGSDGWWRYQLELPPGCYQFRYFSDGQWYTDHAAFGIEHGPFGINSVVKVDRAVLEEARPEAARPAVVKLPHISETDNRALDGEIGGADASRAERIESALAASPV